ncbi:MAG: DUF3592 domain-containing protein [Actinomadura sp.]
MDSFRVRRRDVWRAYLTGWPGRLRRSYVWGPLLAGVILLGFAAWWYAGTMAFTRRAVPTTAVIEEVQRPAPVRREDGLSTHSFYGVVRYSVDGRVTRSRVLLYSCKSSSCAFSRRPGDTVEIAYDPRRPVRATLATAVKDHWTPSGWQMIFGLLGLIFLGAGAVNLIFGSPLGPAGSPDYSRSPPD